MIARILLCTDGSEHALKAASVAAEMASKFAAELTVLSVYHAPPSVLPVAGIPEPNPYLAVETLQHMRDEFHNDAQEKTGRLLRDAGVSFERSQEMGQPVQVITEVAEQINADLIVIGSRGLGGFQRLLMGSVSDAVIHHAHCAVLVVR
jgi:nucleotide-binding universal stress UspA family protein